MTEGDRSPGRRIREIRELNGLTREQLAVQAGVSYPTLVRVEGGAMPSVPSLFQIADALDVSLDDLAGRTPQGTSR